MRTEQGNCDELLFVFSQFGTMCGCMLQGVFIKTFEAFVNYYLAELTNVFSSSLLDKVMSCSQ